MLLIHARSLDIKKKKLQITSVCCVLRTKYLFNYFFLLFYRKNLSIWKYYQLSKDQQKKKDWLRNS